MTLKTLGTNAAMSRELWIKEFGEKYDEQELRRHTKDFLTKYYARNKVPVKKGLYVLLDYLKDKGYKLAVASSSPGWEVESHLKDAAVFDCFQVIVCGDMVSKSKPEPEIYLKACGLLRWTDRLQSSSGDWTGNLFDFFFRVNAKLVKDIKTPFQLEGIVRIDDTPVHKAIREALANCLVNTDFYLPRGVVIKKEPDGIIMENPGSIRTGKKQMLKGGISDPRNKALMKMFNMIGIGERAGSGVPDIYAVWEQQGWIAPQVIEEYDPDRTILKLSFDEVKTKKSAIKNCQEQKKDFGRLCAVWIMEPSTE